MKFIVTGKRNLSGFQSTTYRKEKSSYLSGEFKIVEKQVYDVVTSHYEPKFSLIPALINFPVLWLYKAGGKIYLT
jgi:hypothetical protein